jgi:hypothetical protein
MKMMSRDELKELTERRNGTCVSIYMPTHRAGNETRQDPIRFKNLLREAEQRLAAGGIREAEVQSVLEPARRFLLDASFWARRSDGLAVFASQGVFRHYSMPISVRERVVVADRFHVKPLLPLLDGDSRFYILALSQNRIRLFQGTRFSVAEVELAGVPGSIDEILKYEDPEKSIQVRTHHAGEGTGAMFHGHGLVESSIKEHLRRFFLLVDRGLREFLRDERAPLVLAGVEYLHPIYREASAYPYLVAEGVAGNADGLRPEELHAPAWAAVRPLFLKAQEEAAARFRALAGTGKATGDIKLIVPAAFHGRVDCLFVVAGAERWGTYDRETGEIHLHRKARPGDEDLFDVAAVHTFLNRGTVFMVEPGRMPGGAGLAAIFRY